jgi:hypothetical protein
MSQSESLHNRYRPSLLPVHEAVSSFRRHKQLRCITNPSCQICTGLCSESRPANPHPDNSDHLKYHLILGITENWICTSQLPLNFALNWVKGLKKRIRIVSGPMTISGAHAASYFKGREGSFPDDKPTAA